MADLFYIEQGYFTPDGYYVYTADAASAVVSESSLACELTKVSATEANAELFGVVELAASADKLKSFAIDLSASFDQAADAVKNTDTGSTMSVAFEQTALVGKIVQADIAAITLFNTGVTAFATSSGSVDISSAATISCSGTVVSASAVTLDSIINLSLQSAKFTGYQSALLGTFTQATTATRIQTTPATLQTTATMAVTARVTRRAASSITAQASLTANNTRTRSNQIAQNSLFTQVANARATRRGQAAFTTTSTLTAIGLDLDITSALLNSTSTLTANVRRLRFGNAGLSSTFTLGIQERFYDTGEVLFVSNVDSLLHFSELPLVDVFAAGTPTTVVGEYNGPPPGPPALTLTTGKFGQTIDWPSSDYSLQVSNAVNFDLRLSDFIYEVWYKHGGDINNFGIADGVVMTLDQGADQITTGGVRHNTGIYIYDAAAHSLNNWGLASRQVYLNWSPLRITAPPANQITDHIVAFGVWTHFLISRQGETYYFFIDGVLKNTWTVTRFNTTNPVTMRLGGGGLFGYTDEWRLRKNQSVTSSFTPPTQPYFPPRQIYAKYSYGIWESTTSLTANVLKIKNATANLTSTITSSCVARATKRPVANFTTTATVQTQARKTVRGLSAVQSTATLTAVPRRNRVTSAALQSTSSLVANNIRVRRTTAAFQATSTVYANAGRLLGLIDNLQITATQAATVRKIARITQNFQAFNTVVNVSVKTGRGLITLESRFTLGCSAHKTVRPSISQTSQATLVCSFLKQPQPRQFSASLNSTFTTSVEARRLRFTPITLTSEFTQQSDATAIFINLTPLTASFTTVTNAVAGKIVTVNLTSTTSLTVNTLNSKIMRGTANLQAFDFLFAIGTKITIDPFYQLKVPSETRIRTVPLEMPLLTVDSENRLNIIQAETNTLTVPSESRIWHIPIAVQVGARRVK